MREIYGPAWFATALCAIALVASIFDRMAPVTPAFFCFLPVVFLQMARNVHALSSRIEELEREQGGSAG